MPAIRCQQCSGAGRHPRTASSEGALVETREPVVCGACHGAGYLPQRQCIRCGAPFHRPAYVRLGLCSRCS